MTPEPCPPERGEDPERGDPERGDPERGDLERGDLERGDLERGDPERGDSTRYDGARAIALVGMWIVLALVIAARRSPPADVVRFPDRPVPPPVVDLNRDPWPRLLLIEGIGESLARRIVVARESAGGFNDLDEVRAIPGVPDGAIDRARSWLRLGPPALGDDADRSPRSPSDGD